MLIHIFLLNAWDLNLRSPITAGIPAQGYAENGLTGLIR